MINVKKQLVKQLIDDDFFSEEALNSFLDGKKFGCTCVSGVFTSNNFDIITPFKGNRIDKNENNYDGEDKKRIKEKQDSLKKFGQIEPGIAKFTENGIENMNGNHRFLACIRLNIPYRFVIDNNYSAEKARLAQEESEAWDTASYIKSLRNDDIELGTTIADIASKYENEPISYTAITSIALDILHAGDKNIPKMDKLKEIIKSETVEKIREIHLTDAQIYKVNEGVKIYNELLVIDKMTRTKRDEKRIPINALNNDATRRNGWAKAFLKMTPEQLDKVIEGFTNLSNCSNKDKCKVYADLKSGGTNEVTRIFLGLDFWVTKK